MRLFYRNKYLIALKRPGCVWTRPKWVRTHLHNKRTGSSSHKDSPPTFQSHQSLLRCISRPGCSVPLISSEWTRCWFRPPRSRSFCSARSRRTGQSASAALSSGCLTGLWRRPCLCDAACSWPERRPREKTAQRGQTLHWVLKREPREKWICLGGRMRKFEAGTRSSPGGEEEVQKTESWADMLDPHRSHQRTQTFRSFHRASRSTARRRRSSRSLQGSGCCQVVLAASFWSRSLRGS